MPIIYIPDKEAMNNLQQIAYRLNSIVQERDVFNRTWWSSLSSTFSDLDKWKKENGYKHKDW